jgi:hypothetical protein
LECLLGEFSLLLAVLKPNRIIHKRTDANCSSFHLRVFLGLSNPEGQRKTSTISIPRDNLGERKTKFNLEMSRTTQMQLYKCIQVPYILGLSERIDLDHLINLYHIKESIQGAIVKPGRERPTVLVQLCGGLQSPNRTVSPMGTTTIRTAGGTTCIDNASDISSTALCKIFHLIKVVNLRGIE